MLVQLETPRSMAKEFGCHHLRASKQTPPDDQFSLFPQHEPNPTFSIPFRPVLKAGVIHRSIAGFDRLNER